MHHCIYFKISVAYKSERKSNSEPHACPQSNLPPKKGSQSKPNEWSFMGSKIWVWTQIFWVAQVPIRWHMLIGSSSADSIMWRVAQILLSLHDHEQHIYAKKIVDPTANKYCLIVEKYIHSIFCAHAAPCSYHSYSTTTKTTFCPGSIGPFVPVLEPGFAFRVQPFVPGGRIGTKCPTR